MKNIVALAYIAMKSRLDEQAIRDLGLPGSMNNWAKVSKLLYKKQLPEEMVLALLAYELDTRNRPYLVKRLHSRYAELRKLRERTEIDIRINSL